MAPAARREPHEEEKKLHNPVARDSEIAKKHKVSEQAIYTWRKDISESKEELSGAISETQV